MDFHLFALVLVHQCDEIFVGGAVIGTNFADKLFTTLRMLGWVYATHFFYLKFSLTRFLGSRSQIQINTNLKYQKRKFRVK